MATAEQSPHMNPGEGEASYARNSTVQSAGQNRMMPVIEEAVASLLESTKPHDGRVAIADLGCSSGPNALALVSCAVDAVFQHYARRGGVPPPELCVLLNDLPDNDFNNVAKRLAEFQDATTTGGVIASMVPGSFYKRLFSGSSLHLVLSSNSVPWLSTAPQDLRSNGIPMYDGDDDLREARRPFVLEAYARQFKQDFKRFLNLRAQELVPGGQMVVSLPGRRHSNHVREGVACILNDMAKRGVISREQLDTFYIPMHMPSSEELREIVEEEGSFKISKMLVDDRMMSSSVDRSSVTPLKTALAVRAAFEPLLVRHFGKSDRIVEEFVRTTERHVSAGSQPGVAADVFLCVSLMTKMI